MFTPKRQKRDEEVSEKQDPFAGFPFAQEPEIFEDQGIVVESDIIQKPNITKDDELMLPELSIREPFLASPHHLPKKKGYISLPYLKPLEKVRLDSDMSEDNDLKAGFESQKPYNDISSCEDRNLIGNSGFDSDADSYSDQ